MTQYQSAAGSFHTRPVPTPWSQGFWDALLAGEVAVQSCRDCPQLQHPPTVSCPACGSLNRGWQAVSGEATIYSFTLAHHPVHPGLVDLVPYNIIVAELDEGPRIVSSLVAYDSNSDGQLIGRRVQVEALRFGDIALPVCRLLT